MKKAVRIISAFMALLMLAGILASCSGNKTDVFTLGKYSVTDDVYRYWLSYYKTYYISSFEDVEDTEEGWNTEISDGVTIEQYILTTISDRMKMYLAAEVIFNEYKLSLTESEKQAIENRIDDLVEYYGGKSKLDAALKKSCNITTSTLENVYTLEAKVSKLNSHLYGEDGATPLTDSQINDFYNSNYSRIKYLYFDKINKYVYDDEGNIKTDSSGANMTVELTDDEIAALKVTAEEALAKAKDGEDFNKLIKEYNTPDMDFSESYPDGYTISSSSYTSTYVYTLVSKGMSMEINDIILCEDSFAYYVIAKYPLLENAYERDESGQFDSFTSDMNEYYFSELLKTYENDVVSNEDYLSKVSIKAVGQSIN